MAKSFKVYTTISNSRAWTEMLSAKGYLTSLETTENVATITVEKYFSRTFTAEEIAIIGIELGKINLATSTNY